MPTFERLLGLLAAGLLTVATDSRGQQAAADSAARLALLALRVQLVSDLREEPSYVLTPEGPRMDFARAIAVLVSKPKPLTCETQLLDRSTVFLKCAPTTPDRARRLSERADRVLSKLRLQAMKTCPAGADATKVRVRVGNEIMVVELAVVDAWLRDYAMKYSMSSKSEDCTSSTDHAALSITIGPPGRFLIFPPDALR